MDKFAHQTSLPSPPMPISKTDVTLKCELDIQDEHLRLTTIDNKENLIDDNLLPASVPSASRLATIGALQRRPKTDARSSDK